MPIPNKSLQKQKRKIIVIIDNTFASFYLWKSLQYGTDLVIHSATKYFGRHGTITAGIVCGMSKKLMQEAIEYRKSVGHFISPNDAIKSLFTRQLEKLPKNRHSQFVTGVLFLINLLLFLVIEPIYKIYVYTVLWILSFFL